MKTFRNLAIALALVSPLALAVGCSHEVSHRESTEAGWFGGQTHKVNTEYKNSDGSTSVESETTTVNGNVTTIVRERKTTALDGSVKVDREKRTITKGTDNVVKESYERSQ
jgi:hypothetical protein